MVNEAEKIMTILKPLEGQSGDGTICEELLVKLVTSLEGEVWTSEQVQKVIQGASNSKRGNRVQLSEFVNWLYGTSNAAEPRPPDTSVHKAPVAEHNCDTQGLSSLDKNLAQPIKTENKSDTSASALAEKGAPPPVKLERGYDADASMLSSNANLAGAWSIQGGEDSTEVKIKHESSGSVEVFVDDDTTMKGIVQGSKLVLDAGDGSKMELNIASDGNSLEAEDGEKWVRVVATSKPAQNLPLAPLRKPNRNTPLQSLAGANAGAGPDLTKLPPPGAILGTGPDLTKMPPPVPAGSLPAGQPDLSKIPPPVVTATRPSSQPITAGKPVAQPHPTKIPPPVAPVGSAAQPDLTKIPPPVAPVGSAAQPDLTKIPPPVAPVGAMGQPDLTKIPPPVPTGMPTAQPDLSKIPPPVIAANRPSSQPVAAMAPPPPLAPAGAQPDLTKIPPPMVPASRPNAQPDLTKIPPPL